jgi:transposase
MENYAALIGIDWADQCHEVLVRNMSSDQEQRLELKQTPEAIAQWTSQLRKRYPSGRVAVAVEQKRGALVYGLLKYDFIDIYPVNGKVSARYREALYPSGVKDDPIDSKLLLDLLDKHRGHLRLLKPDDELTRKLGFLVEKRRTLIEERVALTNRLTSILKEYFPQVLKMFADLSSEVACEFLCKWPTLEEAKRRKTKTLERFFYRHHTRRRETIDKRIKVLQEASPLTTDRAVIETSAEMVKTTCEQLKSLNQGITRFEEAIEQAAPQHRDFKVFKSLPNAGVLTAARMIAAFGSDRSRFEDAEEVAKYVGIAPVLRRSGNGNTLVVQFRRGCNKFLRQTFHEFAGQSIAKSYWARRYYEQQLAKSLDPQVAKRALAYKWIRIIFACWKKGELYDEAKYLNSLEQRGSTLVPPAAGKYALVA